MNLFEIIALLIFLFPLAFSPGPGNMFFAANGARFGFVNTLLANLGYHLATIIVTFLIGFGFSVFFSFIEKQYQYIQIIGSIYVMYLAYKFFRADVYNQNSQKFRCTFTDGVVLLVFNPKAYVIISLMSLPMTFRFLCGCVCVFAIASGLTCAADNHILKRARVLR